MIIDARKWEIRPPTAKLEGCPACGCPTTEVTQLHCCSKHRKRANRIRREGGRLLEVEPGTCRVCGTAYEPSPPQRLACSDRCRRELQKRKTRAYAFGYFRARTKWPHPLPWLAAKLGIPENDPRLPQLALKLGEAGHLVVFVRRDGIVGEVGRPKQFTPNHDKPKPATSVGNNLTEERGRA